MNEKPIGKAAHSTESGTDWERLRNLSDAGIHAAAIADTDAQPTDETFWQNAKLVMPETKETVTIRLDSEVLKWFKAQGKGYQTRMNAVLCAYVKAQDKLKQHSG
ncbi:MAG: BrnA antitoxin family protein [Methylococcaceae bacterium]|nr:BrnA antitoxin family protein [Methylococcaceae bacterium]